MSGKGFEQVCRESYEAVYTDTWDLADPNDREEHRVLTEAVLKAWRGK